MINQSRRTALKGMGCGVAALATVSATSTALASAGSSNASANQSLQFIQPNQAITVYLQEAAVMERVTLVNISGQSVQLDNTQATRLEHINGSLVVKLQSTASGDVTIKPGELLVVDIATAQPNTTKNLPNQVSIRSEHPMLNGEISAIAA